MSSRAEGAALIGCALFTLACAPAPGPAQEGIPGIGRYDFEGDGERFELPGRLDEISGLATTADGRLFAHNDERATLNEIDSASGQVGKRFFLGDPPVEADFEGIAIAGERFFLVTSTARLYEFREVGDREVASHRWTDLGFGDSCEVEGLDYDALDDALLVACKLSRPERGVIVVRRVPLDPARPALPPLEIGRSQLPRFGLDMDFRPSSVAVSPDGTIYLASASPEVLIEVDRSGRVIAAVDLPGRRHPQPEGLAFGADGSLYLADEQNGASSGFLTRYRRGPAGGPR